MTWPCREMIIFYFCTKPGPRIFGLECLEPVIVRPPTELHCMKQAGEEDTPRRRAGPGPDILPLGWPSQFIRHLI